MKLYTQQKTKCENCPNILRVPSISPNVIHEMRCSITRYRKNVYRLIHWDRVVDIPEWCSLKDEVESPLPL